MMNLKFSHPAFGILNIFNLFARYVAPEYASTGMLTEKSDIYSFGVMIMEIITGRSPVDYSRPPGEVSFSQPQKKYKTLGFLQ